MRSLCWTSILSALLLATGHAALAADLTEPRAVQVISIMGSKSSSNGYFTFTTAVPVAGCEGGFWAPASDASYAAHLSRVMEAQIQNRPLRVSGDREKLWEGSAEKVCRIAQLS